MPDLVALRQAFAALFNEHQMMLLWTKGKTGPMTAMERRLCVERYELWECLARLSHVIRGFEELARR